MNIKFFFQKRFLIYVKIYTNKKFMLVQYQEAGETNIIPRRDRQGIAQKVQNMVMLIYVYRLFYKHDNTAK